MDLYGGQRHSSCISIGTVLITSLEDPTHQDLIVLPLEFWQNPHLPFGPPILRIISIVVDYQFPPEFHHGPNDNLLRKGLGSGQESF
jgi:hypothetical protein